MFSLGTCELFYWRDRSQEVDFVIRSGQRILALEVKSSGARRTHHGLAAFETRFSPDRILLVGGEGIPLEEFLALPIESWLHT